MEKGKQEELKPCPFCGSKPYTNYGPENGDCYGESWNGWTIGCEECGANIFTQDDTIGEKEKVFVTAKEAWNKRAGV